MLEDIIQDEFADEFDSQSSLQGVLGVKQAIKSQRASAEPKSKHFAWTEEASVAHSVNSRFAKKNGRKLRAKNRFELAETGTDMVLRLRMPRFDARGEHPLRGRLNPSMARDDCLG